MGHCELIFGSMYSGKSEELIRRLKRLKYANQKYLLFKPDIDNRYSENKILTHDHARNNELIKNTFSKTVAELIEMCSGLDAIPIKNSNEIYNYLSSDIQVIGIDEIGFFDDDLVKVVKDLISKDYRVICSGLDMYANGEPFGNIVPYIACISKYVDKLHAVCLNCGEEAYLSCKLDNANKDEIDIGSTEKYIALCEKCMKKIVIKKNVF